MNITKKLCLISIFILLSLSTMKNANCQQQLSAFKNVERETTMSTRTASPPASPTSSQPPQQQVILINSSNNNLKQDFARIFSKNQNNNNNISPQSNQSQKQNLNNITFNLIYMQTLSDSYKNYTNVSSTLIKQLQIIQNKALIISDVTEFAFASDHNQLHICHDDESIIDLHVHDDIRPNRFTQCEDSLKLMKLVMDGLGLQKIPDMTKVNISQQEYSTKYREYLRRVYEQKQNELDEIEMLNAPLQMYSIVPNDTQHGERQKRDKPQNQKSSNFRGEENGKTNILLHFALNFDLTKLQPDGIEEANIRLMLIHSPSLALKNKSNKNNDKSKRRPCGNEGGSGGTGKIPKQHTDTPLRHKQRHLLNLKVYQLLPHGKRVWLDGQKLEIEIDDSNRDRTHNQWLQFDVTKAVQTWLRERQSNLGLEVHCNNCHRIGARILNDPSASPTPSALSSDGDNDYDSHLMPVLNVIGRLGVTHQERLMRKHSTNTDDNTESSNTQYHNNMSSKNGDHHRSKNNNDCYKANQRCCRHTMEVVFKEIKGFEFIIQPKVFDAGYCHGRCPPRYNPAHHHALLQSLIWKHSRTRAPRLCCAPSKLVELEVLHVDEKDSEKLKISTWTDMRVIECACT